MSFFVAITLEYDAKKHIDLALPLDVPCSILAEAIAETLSLRKQKHALVVLGDTRQRDLLAHATLNDAAILDGMILRLVASRELTKNHRRKKAEKAFLHVETGDTLPLNKAVLHIGRCDPKRGIFPDIDLKPYDPDKTVTRRWHAKIEMKGCEYFLTDLNSMNGTRVNGKRLLPNIPQVLEEGDVIEFGHGTVRIIFKMNPSARKLA